MQLIAVLSLALIAGAAAAPASDVQLLRYDSTNDGSGNYRFAYEQSNGQRHEEQGSLLNPGSMQEQLSVTGSYSWVGPDGVTYTVNYVADQNGYQTTIQQGSGGAIPEAVARAFQG